jgi:hypothetical protein
MIFYKSAELGVQPGFKSAYPLNQILAASGDSTREIREMAFCGQLARHTPQPKQSSGEMKTLPCADE